MTFHSFHPGTLSVACDSCGAMVASTDRDKTLHGEWHEANEAKLHEVVVDLRSVEAKVA